MTEAEKRLAAIKEAALSCGIPDCGTASFAECLPLLPCRAAERLPDNARTVIVCIFPYKTPDQPRNISRYAMVQDYHRVAGDMLQQLTERLITLYPDYRFAYFADNSPIREVDAALRAGLGVLGRNSLLIHPKYGSWVFIGEIVTDLPVDLPDHEKKDCIGCGLCEKSCPGGALANGKVDTLHCLSDITQRKGDLTAEEAELVKKGGSLWGCDICSEVCPMNRDSSLTPIPAFLTDIKPVLTREDLTRAVRFRAYGFRGPAPLRRNYTLLYPEDTTK